MNLTKSILIALAVIAPFFAGNQSARAAVYFVAPAGADTNPGTLKRPFATLGRAQRAVREVHGREPVKVYLRQGVYYLPRTMTFTAKDSGTARAPVLYAAYQKEHPVISGGVRLRHLHWTPYRNGIFKAPVPVGFATDQLFVNGELQHLARYPNYDPSVRIYNGYAADAISPARVRRWADPRGGFIHAIHGYRWGSLDYVITGKDATGKLLYRGGWQNNRPAPMHKKYRFVENIFEELDAPGEWYLNRKISTLYYEPPAGLDLSRAVIEGARLKNLVQFQGSERHPVRFITLRGLTFRQAARTFMETREPILRSDWCIYRGGAIFFNGAEDCALEDCFIDRVGGNAVFVNDYNRRLKIQGCHIFGSGASGVAFVGNPQAVRDGIGWKQQNDYRTLDMTPGPRSDDFPADCLVDDCLIHQTGRIEKQTAGVEIDMAERITVRHCSLYDMPRAGINIGDGCWGGDVIEFCDVFDTVRETGDHGSFNSWGRDRYWHLKGLDLNDDRTWQAHRKLPLLDVVQTNILRNNRWRCDHGWAIDLDDGSSNYHIYNNLCLHGGIKNREGFYRVVENNILVNDGFHPHVWFKHSQDVVRRNIMWSDHYMPAGGMPATPWGKEMDDNLVERPGMMGIRPASKLARQSQRDAHSIIGDALFVDPARGDYRVKKGSPALKLGFVNFPMDEFGVQRPELKKIARTPRLPGDPTGESRENGE